MNNYMPFNNYNQAYQPYQSQQLFPQPQGNIYMITNSNEINNIPANSGLSAAICLSEGLVYLKTLQNGSPMVVSYRLTPTNGPEPQNETTQADNNLEQRVGAILKDYNDRIEALEKYLNSTNNIPKQQGGGLDWSTI